MILHLLLTALISYLIGTIPFALIFSKLLAKKNPGKEGSKNYGALNSYEITGKKIVGLLVLLFDAMKGALAVLFAYYCIFPKSFYAVIAAFFVVLGHNFNIFLKFKGGRGLATSLGALLVFNPFILIVWCSVWFLFYKIIKNDILFANTWASLITPVVIFSAPDYAFYIFNYNFNIVILEYKIFAIMLCMTIIAAHYRKS